MIFTWGSADAGLLLHDLFVWFLVARGCDLEVAVSSLDLISSVFLRAEISEPMWVL